MSKDREIESRPRYPSLVNKEDELSEMSRSFVRFSIGDDENLGSGFNGVNVQYGVQRNGFYGDFDRKIDAGDVQIGGAQEGFDLMSNRFSMFGFDNGGLYNIGDSQSSSSFVVDDNRNCSINCFNGGIGNGGFSNAACNSVEFGPFNSSRNLNVYSGSNWCDEMKSLASELSRDLRDKRIQFWPPCNPQSVTGSRQLDSGELIYQKLTQDVYAQQCQGGFSLMSNERANDRVVIGSIGSNVSLNGGQGMEMYDYVRSRRERDSLRGRENSTFQNLRGQGSVNGSCENSQRMNVYLPAGLIPEATPLARVRGHVLKLAQDQHGYQYLVEVLNEGSNEAVKIVFDEVMEYTVELVIDPFGNYVMQKLLEVCGDEQRLKMLLILINESGQLARICLSTYGTRVAQKLIETLKTRKQIELVMLALKPSFLELMTDSNGYHVIQRCLQHLSIEDNKPIFDAAAKYCLEIATHRHGCSFMQRCIECSFGQYRTMLISEISRKGLLLAQDPFGNYVVQYIIEQKSSAAEACLLSQFKGHYVPLSMQKFSSHVVEKCLKHLEESRSQIVREFLSAPCFEQLLQDPYANYVIQFALRTIKGPQHSLLVEAVGRHQNLRNNPYCRRIFSQNLLKK